MDANQIELHATETLLQRGVKVLVRAPFLLRLLRIKRIGLTLRAPTAGALKRMGYQYLHCQLSADKLENIAVEDALLFNVKYGKYIYRALACLFLVGKIRTRFFMKPMAAYLEENMQPKEALTLLQLAILHGGIEDFMTTTRLVRMKMITVPRLGQKTKRS